VTVTGTDFAPPETDPLTGETVRHPITLAWDGQTLATFTIDGRTFSREFTVPADAEWGDHLITASQQAVAGTPSVGFRVEAKYEIVAVKADGHRLTARLALRGSGDGGGRTTTPQVAIYQWRESR
jgi:hypothetical protein